MWRIKRCRLPVRTGERAPRGGGNRHEFHNRRPGWRRDRAGSGRAYVRRTGPGPHKQWITVDVRSLDLEGWA